MGSTPVGGSENYFSEYFDLRTLLRYHVILASFARSVPPFHSLEGRKKIDSSKITKEMKLRGRQVLEVAMYRRLKHMQSKLLFIFDTYLVRKCICSG